MTDILFDDSGIAQADRPELESALAKLCDGTGSPPWDRRPDRVVVQRRLSGLGGATVLEIAVHRGRHTSIQVVKVGPAEMMRQEYRAYHDVIKPAGTDLCPPIEMATAGARGDGEAHANPLEREVIVYHHVAQYAADPGSPLTTLEDVFIEASRGDAEAAARATDAVASMFERAQTLYRVRAHDDQPSSLRKLAETLGPAIVVEIDRLGAEDWATLGEGVDEGPLRYGRDIFLTGTRHSGAPIAVGDRIRITGLKPERKDGGLIGKREHAAIGIVVREPGDANAIIGMLAAKPKFHLSGSVAQIRPEVAWQRMQQAIDGLHEDCGLIRAPGIVAAHPFSALEHALTRIDLEPVRSRVHGDLNSRNVLLVTSAAVSTPATRPYWIDYAHADRGGHTLADFTWLEINLLRAASCTPSLADLVRLQRILTATSLLFPFADRGAPRPAPVLSNVAAMVAQLAASSPGLATAWPVLVQVRWDAYRSYPEPLGHRWFADYLRHLTLAAHRTFKWPDAIQSPVRWAASVAAASVAAEWSDPALALRHWPDAELVALIVALPALLPSTQAAAGFLATVTTEVSLRQASGADRLAGAEVAEALATVANAVAADALPTRPSDEVRRTYIDLSATGAEPSPPDPESALAVLGRAHHAVLVGPAGAGKTTVVREMADRMTAVAGNRSNIHGGERHRLPIIIAAQKLISACQEGLPIEDIVAAEAPFPRDLAGDLLAAGCLHLVVDSAPDSADKAWQTVAKLVDSVRDTYPYVPVLLCCRSEPAQLSQSFSVYRLGVPTTAQAIGFLTERAISGNVPVSAVRRLLTGPGAEVTAELLDSPMFLDMLGAHLSPEASPPTVGDVLDRHLLDTGWEQAFRIAGEVAAQLADRAILAVDDETVSGWLEPDDRIAWPSACVQLVERDVLRRQDGTLTFSRPIYCDYFAATAVERQPATLMARARRLSWQEPLRLAVSRRGAVTGALAAILPTVQKADPRFAGRLLAAAPHPPLHLAHKELIREFVAEQDAVLRDPDCGDMAWLRAAEALHALGSHGTRMLSGVVRDRHRPNGARLAGLNALGSVTDSVHPTRAEPAEPLAAVLDLLADPAQPPELRVAAVSFVADRRAIQLVLFITDGFDDGTPWPYMRSAHSALSALGVPLPARLLDLYQRAAQRRLSELDDLMPTLTVTAQHREARRERIELLLDVAKDDAKQLLRRRFSFDLGGIARRAIDQLDPSTVGNEASLLWETMTANELLDRFTSGDDSSVAAVAHRLLRDAPQRSGDLVSAVGTTDTAIRLLAAAEAAPVAGPASLPHVENLLRALAAEQRDGDRNEALAALMRAAASLDATRGALLADHVHAVLTAAGDPSRCHWPLSVAVARFKPQTSTWDSLLCSDNAEERDLGVAVLSTPSFHLDASPAPGITPPLSDAAHRALRSATPAPEATWAAVDFVRSAATAGHTDGLTLVRELLELPDLSTLERTFPDGRYGTMTVSGLSEVLSAGGYLTRLGLLAGDPSTAATATAVAERIEAIDIARCHTSVAAGRLIALGYLGNPGPLLRHLDTAEPRLHAAARHAVLQWSADGPRVAPPWHDASHSAEAIAVLLKARSVSPQARSTLLTILEQLCQRSGQLPSPALT